MEKATQKLIKEHTNQIQKFEEMFGLDSHREYPHIMYTAWNTVFGLIIGEPKFPEITRPVDIGVSMVLVKEACKFLNVFKKEDEEILIIRESNQEVSLLKIAKRTPHGQFTFPYNYCIGMAPIITNK